MTVKDLAKQLAELVADGQGDRVVVLSRDGEGNGFAELYDLDDNARFSACNGEVGPQRLTPEMKRQGFTSEDVKRSGKPALVLWP